MQKLQHIAFQKIDPTVYPLTDEGKIECPYPGCTDYVRKNQKTCGDIICQRIYDTGHEPNANKENRKDEYENPIRKVLVWLN